VHPQPLRVDPEIEHAGAACGERVAHGRRVLGFADAEQAPAAACTADFARLRSRAPRRGEHRVDLRRRDARREPFSVLPFLRDLKRHAGPVGALERLAHRDRDVANARETLLHAAIAVDVTLGHFPVVDAGIPRGVRVGEREARLQFLGADVERHAAHAVDAEFDGRDPPVIRRPIVLDAGWNIDRLRLHVHRDLEDLIGAPPSAAPGVERAAHRDIERGGSGDAGADRRF
jgi:hypothetical protein